MALNSNDFSHLCLTEDGFLQHTGDWNHQVAHWLAGQEEIILTDDHWFVLNKLQEFHMQFHHAPNMRALLKWLQQESNNLKWNSMLLAKLFPKAALKQAHLIAGLPKPPYCT